MVFLIHTCSSKVELFRYNLPSLPSTLRLLNGFFQSFQLPLYRSQTVTLNLGIENKNLAFKKSFTKK